MDRLKCRRFISRWDHFQRFTPSQTPTCHEYTASIYLFKVNNRNTRKRCKICSKLTIKTPERRHWRRTGVFIVNFENTRMALLTSYWCLYRWLWAYFTPCSSVSIGNFEYVNAGWATNFPYLAWFDFKWAILANNKSAFSKFRWGVLWFLLK